MDTRLNRLDDIDRASVISLVNALNDPTVEDKNALFAQFGRLVFKADSYDIIQETDDVIDYQYCIFQSVWKDAESLRRTGVLLDLGRKIKCPVVAIHGDFDPHPVEGVKGPLSRVLKDFRFILIEKCGHRPWTEKFAKDDFNRILMKELE
jgi:pimeloyl-ACP methyl ester carboxylesterase